MKVLRVPIRARFALTAAGLFVVAGLALTAVNYVLVRSSLRPTIERVAIELPVESGGRIVAAEQPGVIPKEQAGELSRRLAQATLRTLLSRSGVALAIGALACLLLAWILAGRFLRPVRRVTEAARDLSAHTLSQRLRLDGPTDELKELADTFDGMLERLESAFEAQRRFAANASHELRTPLTLVRTAVEVVDRKGEPTPQQVHAATEKVRIAVDRSERLIDGLLVLARSEARLAEVRTVDVAELVRDAVEQGRVVAESAGVHVHGSGSCCLVEGDRTLLERMLWNLVENAIAYNVRGGWVDVSVREMGQRCVVDVANTGPQVDPAEVDGLFEPFRRAGVERVGASGGAGLGLSIVRAIASTHQGTVRAEPRSVGGLVVTVELPCSR